MSPKRKILLVEDEVAIARGLVDVFVFHGYEADWCADGAQGLKKAQEESYDLLILDVMLPSKDGFSICNEIRSHDREQPIIMLTAKGEDEDVIHGLTLGADDYISKPFSVHELVLRVEAVLRRARRGIRKSSSFQLTPEIVVDSENLFVRLEAKREDVALSRKEVEILEYLTLHRDRPVSRGELLVEVWGYRKASEVETRTVDIHIAKLRKKLERDPKEPTLITTVRGEGYRLGDGK